ncbi:MAG: nucleotidyltransferase [Deltaproteobacteria bacterium]|nr:nucleotidyltransferase [Deltaproteobacteria bacterium]
MHDPRLLIRRLAEAHVDFVLVGGLAGIVQGMTRVTQDVDICAALLEANLARLIDALAGTNPRFRGPPRLPFPADAGALLGYKNLYLETDDGELDVLGEIEGIGSFEQVKARSVALPLFGSAILSLDLDALIDAKRALNREKDRGDLRELELIRAKRHRS